MMQDKIRVYIEMALEEIWTPVRGPPGVGRVGLWREPKATQPTSHQCIWTTWMGTLFLMPLGSHHFSTMSLSVGGAESFHLHLLQVCKPFHAFRDLRHDQILVSNGIQPREQHATSSVIALTLRL
jgi:hypothetical protein